MIKVLVTGGAGFIGSHLVDRLIKLGNHVVVFDNLTSGRMENLEHLKGNKNFTFIKGDLLNQKEIETALNGISIVYHAAADPNARPREGSSITHFEQNIVATFNILEAMRKKNIEKIVFLSSSVVYGDAEVIPTPENYTTMPISTYGASKLANEAMISSYYHTYGIKGVVFRFANVIGRRSDHGVIYDFIGKLKKNPKELEILGDGTQTKSYIYIDDCIDAMIFAERNVKDDFEIFNIGSEETTTVTEIADIVVKVLGLNDVKYSFTGGSRGWKGDVRVMQLSIEKLKSLGWKPKYKSNRSVEMCAKDLKRLFD